MICFMSVTLTQSACGWRRWPLGAQPLRASCSWHIWADLAAVLIRRAKRLYADESLGLEVNIPGKVYAPDASTIDLCLSLFDWAPFRSTKAAIKLHTLLDLRGAIPNFIHISDGKMHDVRVLDALPI